jgi:hypothetical protein
MTNLITLQTIFIKDDVSIRLNKLDNHLKQIQCLLLDSNNNDVVKSLITETMYFIEWIAPGETHLINKDYLISIMTQKFALTSTY